MKEMVKPTPEELESFLINLAEAVPEWLEVQPCSFRVLGMFMDTHRVLLADRVIFVDQLPELFDYAFGRKRTLITGPIKWKRTKKVERHGEEVCWHYAYEFRDTRITTPWYYRVFAVAHETDSLNASEAGIVQPG